MIGGTINVLYGYRPSEIGLTLKDSETPDPSYKLKAKTSQFFASDRKAVRKSLGCHVEGAALPVPDLNYAPDQVAGAVKRVAAAMPKINRTKLRKFKRFVKRWCRDHLTEHIFTADEDFDFQEWIDSTPYQLYRKEELIKIYGEGIFTEPKYKVKAFIKDEHYSEWKHLRGIYSRHDDYKVRVGPFFKKIGDIFFSLKWFIKKIPVNDRPKWLLEKFGDQTNIFCTDFSQFEATFTKQLMNVENIVYGFLLQNNPHKKKIMDLITKGMMSINHIQFHKWSMNLMCKRMSGEMSTSVSNGFMNLLLTHFLLQEAGNKLYDSSIEGDDSMNHYDVRAPTAQEYEELGAKIKIEHPSNLCEASFCGQIFDREDLDNVANPMEALVSFGWTKSQYMVSNKNTLKKLLKAKSLSLLYEYSGCPILRSLALYGLRVTNDVLLDDVYKTINKQKLSQYERETWIEMLDNYDENHVFTNSVKSNTRSLVARKFGLSIIIQQEIEEYLDNKIDISPIDLTCILERCDKSWIDYYNTYGVPTENFEIKAYAEIPKVNVTTGHKCKVFLNPKKFIMV